MDDLALDRGHRIELHRFAVLDGPLRRPHRERFQRRLPPRAISRRVDDDLFPGVEMTAERDRVREVLNRVDRLAVAADQHAQVGTGDGERDQLVLLTRVDPARNPDRRGDPLDELAHLSRERALLARLGSSHVVRHRRHHPRRRVTDPEQSPLPLGEHLEPHRRLVQAGLHLLELPEGGPLRLPDGLSRRLDLEIAQRFAFFFFRFTRRGGPGAAAGAGASAVGFAPSATGGGSGDGSFGGVREVRFGPAPPVGGGVFGIKRRVISPWPTVQRLVVIQ